MSRLKSYNGKISSRPAWNTRRYDGGYAAIVSAAVRTTSKKAAAETLGVSLHEFNNYFSETGNRPTLEALDRYPPNTVLIAPDVPGDTIDGTKEWRPRP